MQNNCAVCFTPLTLTIVYVEREAGNPVPKMWKEVDIWYQRAANEYPEKLACKNCGLLYDHEAI